MIVKTPADIGGLIREQRTRLGLDQSELAKKAETSRKWIVEIERGKPGASLGLVLRTLRVLGIGLQVTDIHAKPVKSVTDPHAVNLDDVIDSLKRRR